MDVNFEKAFKSLEDCVGHIGKGIEDLFEGLTTEKEEGSKIRIKKGSKVYIGKGIAVKLLSDIEAEIMDEDEAPTEESKI